MATCVNSTQNTTPLLDYVKSSMKSRGDIYESRDMVGAREKDKRILSKKGGKEEHEGGLVRAIGQRSRLVRSVL